MPVGQKLNENVSLSAPRSVPVQPLTDQPVYLVARVANHSEQKRTVTVNASVEDEPIGTKEITLDEWSSGEVRFETTLTTQGAHRVVFSIVPDDLAIDNHAYLTVRSVRRVPVVVIGDDSPDEPGSTTYFLTRGLAPRGDDGDELVIQHFASAGLKYASIADAEAVFVGYVGELSREALDGLFHYLSQGGGVAFFCGNDTTAANLLAFRKLDPRSDLLPWIPSSLRDLASEGGFLTIESGRWGSKALRDFDEPAQDAFKRIRFTRVHSGGALRQGADELLRFSDGTPAMAAMPVGAGKMLLCNFTPDLAGSDLGKYGTFVVLMRGIFDAIRPTRQFGGDRITGKAFTCSVPYPARGEPGRIKVIAPDGRLSDLDVTRRNDRWLVHIRHPKVAGFYEIRNDTNPVRSGPDGLLDYVAVNVDVREGELRRISKDVLHKAMSGPDRMLEIQDPSRSGPILRVHGQPMWHLFVLAAMGAFFLEQVLLSVWKQ